MFPVDKISRVTCEQRTFIESKASKGLRIIYKNANYSGDDKCVIWSKHGLSTSRGETFFDLNPLLKYFRAAMPINTLLPRHTRVTKKFIFDNLINPDKCCSGFTNDISSTKGRENETKLVCKEERNLCE